MATTTLNPSEISELIRNRIEKVSWPPKRATKAP